jgi:hypothetical protein
MNYNQDMSKEFIAGLLRRLLEETQLDSIPPSF